MADKNDYFRVIPANMLKVTPKQESHQNQQDQKNKKKEEKPEDNSSIFVNSKYGIQELDSKELIELGRLIIDKRNSELKLFIRMRNKDQMLQTEAYNQKTIEADIILLQRKIAELNMNVSELDFRLFEEKTTNDSSLENSLDFLNRLKQLYELFYDFVKEEQRILNIEDIDFLEDILKQKETVLNQIVDIQKNINFEVFKEISPENEKKAKANEILSDIHNVMNEIIRQEDENSVELQNVREKMKLNISRQDKGAKVISQYAQSSMKSHFIDTKK